jgi:hypothetical protein
MAAIWHLESGGIWHRASGMSLVSHRRLYCTANIVDFTSNTSQLILDVIHHFLYVDLLYLGGLSESEVSSFTSLFFIFLSVARLFPFVLMATIVMLGHFQNFDPKSKENVMVLKINCRNSLC